MTLLPSLSLADQCRALKSKYSVESDGQILVLQQLVDTIEKDQSAAEYLQQIHH